MPDIKTVKIKKSGGGEAPSGVTLPKFAQQAAEPTPEPTGKPWTWVAIVATISALLFATLVIFQSIELKHYSDPETVWPPQGPR
jgi:hypothetical protein